MAKKAVSRCTACGSPVAAGETLCPRCRATSTTDTGIAPGSDGLPLELLPARSTTRGALVNTLFECWRCSRLVEAQMHQGRSAFPRFCPWCGKPVSSILGRELDAYRIDELIATGSFGYIYLASNVAQPLIKAAVKFLRPEMFYRHPELVRVFVEEARLTEEIGQACRNIVRVSNVREEPWPYIVMEFVRGTTMDEVIEAAGPKHLPLDDCLGYLLGIARALSATHRHGRVHRDLKPLNIMVMTSEEVSRAEDKVKLLDFGLAMRIASRRVSLRASQVYGADAPAEEDSRDSPIQSAGTPEYMAPEAFDGVNDYSADIYSFGVTAYQLLTGELPWRDPPLGSERLFYWREAHKRKVPRPIRELRSDVPGWLAKVVLQCLEKDPIQRPGSAEELVERLRKPISPWIWGASAAAVLLIAVLGWLAGTGGRQRETLQWTVDKKLFKGDHVTVWAASEAGLQDREVFGMVQSEKEITACSSPTPGVHIERQRDRFLVRLDPDPALIGAKIPISGRGAGFRFDGEIQIERDADRPEVGSLEISVAPGGDPRPLERGMRLRADEVELRVRVTEPQFREAKLRLEGARGELPPVEHSERPVPGSAGESVSLTFPLKGLPEGHYRAWVVAEDLARNSGPDPPRKVELIIDESVLLYPTQDWKALVARRKAFYGFRLGEDERIQAVEAFDRSGKSAAVELFTAPEDAQAADLVAKLDRVKPEDLRPKSAYLLALPLEDPAAGATFKIRVKDASIPPKPLELTLSCEPQALLASGLVERVSVKLKGEAAPRHLTLSELDSSSPFELAQKEILFVRSASIEKLEVVRRAGEAGAHLGTLLYATCSLEGVPPAKALFGSVSFSNLKLKAGEDNDVVLALHDPLETELRIKLRLHPDTVPPVITIQPGLKAHPSFYRSAAEVDLRVKASEPMSEVTVSVESGGSIKPLSAALDPGSSEYLFPGLNELLKDGSHALTINGLDRASNPAKPLSVQVVLDSGPPDVKPINAEEEKDANGKLKYWKLSGSRCLLSILDPNGVDGSAARCQVEYREKAEEKSLKTATVSLSLEGEATGRYSIDLKGLPRRCAGFLKPLIADKLGLQCTQRIPFQLIRAERPKARVDDWKGKGLSWILVDQQFFVSNTEVSNRIFNDPSFTRNGSYRDPDLNRKYKRPLYWGDGGQFPEYVKEDGTLEPGSDFPVVGVSPAEADLFARTVFGPGFRLPERHEWLRAARRENPGGKYPWKEEQKGRDWCNCRDTRNRETSLIGQHRYRGMKKWNDEKEYPYQPVEVNRSLFPPDLRRGGTGFAAILHMIGNVAELVKLPNGTYAACGGNHDTEYGQAALDLEPDPYVTDRLNRNFRTGFRLVVPADAAPPEFWEPEEPGTR